jgi:hypothetical protein
MTAKCYFRFGFLFAALAFLAGQVAGQMMQLCYSRGMRLLFWASHVWKLCSDGLSARARMPPLRQPLPAFHPLAAGHYGGYTLIR